MHELNGINFYENHFQAQATANTVGMLVQADFASILCSIHPILFSALLFIIPESPVALVKLNREKDALRSLCWLEATGLSSFFYPFSKSNLIGSHEISSKLDNIKVASTPNSNNNMPSKVTCGEFFKSPELTKPVLMVICQMLLAQFCGINVSTFYTVEIFQMSGDMMIDPKMATVILAIIQTIGCVPCSIFVDKYGRRLLLMTSFFAMALAMGGFTAYFYVQFTSPDLLTDSPASNVISLIPLISLIIYNLAYSWGVGSIVWIVMSEILPPKIIGPASSVANATFWGAAFVVTQTFQMFKNDVALHFWFLIFTISCVLGFLFNLLILPETKGLTLPEIQALFQKNSKAKEAHSIAKKLSLKDIP